jgi:hypothetical protein
MVGKEFFFIEIVGELDEDATTTPCSNAIFVSVKCCKCILFVDQASIY